jgi:hypothetical protein
MIRVIWDKELKQISIGFHAEHRICVTGSERELDSQFEEENAEVLRDTVSSVADTSCNHLDLTLWDELEVIDRVN